jgi:hypothetical protein
MWTTRSVRSKSLALSFSANTSVPSVKTIVEIDVVGVELLSEHECSLGQGDR